MATPTESNQSPRPGDYLFKKYMATVEKRTVEAFRLPVDLLDKMKYSSPWAYNMAVIFYAECVWWRRWRR